MDAETGAMSAGGRFDRMEDTLKRIEMKLDTKVSIDEFKSAIARISALESGETPLGKVLVAQFTKTQDLVTDLTLHGSTQAQEANKLIAQLETEVESMKTRNAAQDALIEDRYRLSTKRYQTLGAVLTVVSIVSLVLGLLALFAHHIS